MRQATGAAVLAAAVFLGACVDPGAAARPNKGDLVDPRTLTEAPRAAPTTTPASSTTVAVTLDTTVNADEVALSIGGPVRRGQPATVNAVTASNAMCAISVTSPDGRRVEGLDAKGADGAGSVSWSWIVPGDAILGAWSVMIDCTTVSGIRAVAREVLYIE